ncbi:LPXTG cell wall anchor domain-containing protein [Nakamurella alba]|nr:LPXTG cell wall anchor domain-containing protein [Nakamurella alba]
MTATRWRGLAGGALAAAVLTAGVLVGTAGSAVAAPLGEFTVTPDTVAPGGGFTFAGTGCLPMELGEPDPQVLLYILAVNGEPVVPVRTTKGTSAPTDQVIATSRAEPTDPVPSTVAEVRGSAPADETIIDVVDVQPDGTWAVTYPPGETVAGVVFTIGALCSGYNSSFEYEPVKLTFESGPAEMYLPGFAAGAVPQVRPGLTYDVVGFFFEPGEEVSLAMDGTPGSLGTLIADENGDVAATFTVPAGMPAGQYTLTLTGLTSGITSQTVVQVLSASAPVTTTVTTVPSVTTVTTVPIAPAAPTGSTAAGGFPVTAVPVAATGTDLASAGAAGTTAGTPDASQPAGYSGGGYVDPQLASTGTDAGVLLPIGALMALAGAGLLLAGRRRAVRHH